MTATVSVKGQTVIPAELRKRYGILPNSTVEFIDTGKEIVVVPLPAGDRFKNSFGALRGAGSRDVIKARRKERLREQQEGS